SSCSSWRCFLADGHRRRAAQRVNDRETGVAQLVALAFFENDVLQLVVLGNPDRALQGADGAARSVVHLEQLAVVQSQAAGLKFEFHVGLLVVGMRMVHPCCIALKREMRSTCMPDRNAKVPPRLPSLALLKGFEPAARLLSFTKAGEELHLTQSAVSRQIQELEDQLCVSLFDPRHRAVCATDS